MLLYLLFYLIDFLIRVYVLLQLVYASLLFDWFSFLLDSNILLFLKILCLRRFFLFLSISFLLRLLLFKRLSFRGLIRWIISFFLFSYDSGRRLFIFLFYFIGLLLLMIEFIEEELNLMEASIRIYFLDGLLKWLINSWMESRLIVQLL